jgi:hypothetical protein
MAGLGANVAMHALRAQLRRIRKSTAHPFGLGPTSGHPSPVFFTDVQGDGSGRSLITGMLGLQTHISTMTLTYGLVYKLNEPYAEVISDFDEDVRESRPLADELVDAVRRDSSQDGDVSNELAEESGEHDIARQDFEIEVLDTTRSVLLMRLGDHCALQFEQDEVLVTLVARKLNFSPIFVRFTELEPILRAMEGIDRSDLAGWFLANRDK